VLQQLQERGGLLLAPVDEALLAELGAAANATGFAGEPGNRGLALLLLEMLPVVLESINI
jgi:hypothetical protein